jgi:hypothetical protein
MAQLINKAQMRPVLWHHLKERKTIFFHQQKKGEKTKRNASQGRVAYTVEACLLFCIIALPWYDPLKCL